MKSLPLGISTLGKLMDENCVYVDKTQMAWQLVRQAGAYFLSRPRRFGKSLFVDTLQQIFEGNHNLFAGLYIHERWDWSKVYPVIKIDFSEGTLQSRQELDTRIWKIFRQNCKRLGVSFEADNDVPGAFADIIQASEAKTGHKAVVLVDEYDKPILDNIDNSQVAAAMREGLKNLYSVLKGQDAHLQFVFMTGVSKFSKVSLFSGLNQLVDITLDAAFSTICGYTDSDLRIHFGEHLQGVDWDKLQKWYNGYQWLGQEPIYNPYDILLFIHKGHVYRNYWFETGTTDFLIQLFRRKQYFLPSLENVQVTEDILDSFEVEGINPLTLLFQTGYLTIDHTFTRKYSEGVPHGLFPGYRRGAQRDHILREISTGINPARY